MILMKCFEITETPSYADGQEGDAVTGICWPELH